MSYNAVGSVHIASALGAIVLGAFVLLSPKGTPAHRLVGLGYVFASLLLDLSALSIYDMTGHFGPFHAGAIFNLACIVMGVSAPILRDSDWLNRHYRWMGWSYFGLLAAGFAEAAVRIPAFEVHTATRGFAVALGATLCFSLFGRLFMRRLGFAVSRYGRHCASMTASIGKRP
jgi:uncharacterized membrane protein